MGFTGDYYQKKTQAYRFIDDLVGKGLTFDQILYKVETNFGFSDKFVKKRIDLIERLTGETTDEKPKKKEDPKK